MAERINWKLALPLTVGGVALFLWGLALGKFTRGTWSDALIHVGSIIGLLAVLASLERRLLRNVAETAKTVATDAAERTTADLRDRIVRLEDLDEAQVHERERRRLRAEGAVERLEGEAITAETVGDLVGYLVSSAGAPDDG